VNLELFKESIANSIRNTLVRTCPVDTGDLKKSITTSVTPNGIDINMVEYAKYVEYGTAPHIIRAVNAKALHWKNNGKHVFAKQVFHPGTRPQPFIRNAFNHQMNQIIATAAKHLPPGTEITVEVTEDDFSN
jgi:HK97 gp10 family phage protein